MSWNFHRCDKLFSIILQQTRKFFPHRRNIRKPSKQEEVRSQHSPELIWKNLESREARERNEWEGKLQWLKFYERFFPFAARRLIRLFMQVEKEWEREFFSSFDFIFSSFFAALTDERKKSKKQTNKSTGERIYVIKKFVSFISRERSFSFVCAGAVAVVFFFCGVLWSYEWPRHEKLISSKLIELEQLCCKNRTNWPSNTVITNRAECILNTRRRQMEVRKH